MCRPEEKPAKEYVAPAPPPPKSNSGTTCFLGFTTIAFMASTIALAVVYSQEKDKNAAAPASNAAAVPAPAPVPDDSPTSSSSSGGSSGYSGYSGGGSSGSSTSEASDLMSNGYGVPLMRPPAGDNPCAGKKPDEVEYFDNVDCLRDGVLQSLEQAGANVTVGYTGDLDASGREPITTPYFEAGLCPVNVHWHLGAEHYSAGQFDEYGIGPRLTPRTERTRGYGGRRKAQGRDVRLGFQCRHYDESDPKFTTPYDWKHCIDMEVGQTYEVHWPHSAAGACGTPNQYQTPFYDGVFCNDGILSLDPLNTYEKIGVQSQVFTIVNDEDYYWPDLMRGMIVDAPRAMGTEITKYTGSTTGTTRNNEICSRYTPVTWQVDRKCHLVSASTFDKMCADMKAQRDDMSDDLYAHGSRELVADYIAANNHQNLRRKA